MRAVIYARFSSNLQRDASIEDQIRECRAYADRHHYTVIKTYEDRAISGASTLTRPRLQTLLRDAQSGLFDIVIVEALDRLSRSLADTAKLHDVLKFHGVEVQTISSGVVNTMQIGFMGTMNQIFLDELGKKTKRGQKGRVAKGRIPGGLSYGYDMVAGDERGKRVINSEQADIVRRIFTQYARGYSPRAIAKELNTDGIPSPRGGQWQASTINGNIKRGNGILPNQLYIGKIVYNRQSFIKNPSTGKRIARLNPHSEWITHDVPELAIIEPDLWAKVAARKSNNTKYPEYHRRAHYLISGLLECEECRGPYTVSGKNHMRCSHHRERGTCSNGASIKIADVEARILDALKSHLLDPEYIETFLSAYKEEWQNLDQSSTHEREALHTSYMDCERAIASLITTLEGGVISPAITLKLYEREQELIALKAQLNMVTRENIIPLPTDLTTRWRHTLNNMQTHIAANDIVPASEDLKTIVKRVIVTPKRQKAYDLEIIGFLKSNVGCGSH